VDFSRFKRVCILLAGAAFTGASAHANILFNITYTPAVQNDTNFTNIQSAVNYVKGEFSALYSDPIALNFTITEGPIGLGSSLFSNSYWRGSYTDLRTALVGDNKTADDATATAQANLPLADPYGVPAPNPNGLTAANDWYATSAEAKALGLLTDQSLFDGTYTFDNTVSYTYDPNNRAVSGKYDFIGVTEHEFSELMGRTQQSNQFGYNIFDTMRFTSVGVRNVNLSGVSGVYFSFDNGVTNLAGFNAGGGDKQDLNGGVATDPFNASTGPNQAHSLNETDKALLDVIGYDRVSAAPEPSTFLLALPLLGFGLARMRKRAQAR
jgi:hypothetical protein